MENMAYSGPLLPEAVLLTGRSAQGVLQPVSQLTSSMQHGCYFAQWIPPTAASELVRYNGVMRIEKRAEQITASGDLYRHHAFKRTNGGTVINPDPSPSAGIPIFPRKDYAYYLSVTDFLEQSSTENTVTLKFDRHSYNEDDHTWTDDGKFTAQMAFKPAPEGYRSGATYMEGQITDSSNTVVGDLKLGWVSKYLRKATLEVDRVSESEYPADNGNGLGWKDVYDAVDWDVRVYESDANLIEPSGISWSDTELHAKMLKRRDSMDLDGEWRYYLICVRRTSSYLRGVMYDYRGTDSNETPREGAAIATHWVIPNLDKWGSVQGMRFGASGPPYFRTAVHEIGHAMGLLHNTDDNGFMNTTGAIATSPGTFPTNIQWTFNAADEHRLRHLPDPSVRPGMIPFGTLYDKVPISAVNRVDLSQSLGFDVKPLLSAVPIGAPVRVRLTLRNTTDAPIEAPASLSLKSGHVNGSIVGPGGVSRGFQSVIRCVDESEHQTLKPDDEISHDLTLLRGSDGALFEAPGLHQVKVDILWTADKVPFCVRGSAAVMIQPALTDSHAEAALKTLTTPDLLLTLVLGGDHLEAGVDALRAALADETLAPHYSVIEAKRLCRRFRTRDADPAAALKLLTKDTIMSPSEAKSVASLVGGVAKPSKPAMEALKKSAAGDKAAEEEVNKL